MGESKLTPEELRALSFFASSRAIGPAAGWNADVELATDNGGPIDGRDLAAIFRMGFVSALPIPPPHTEQFDAEAGSIVCDHEWSITPDGRAALIALEAQE